jgi:asparagine synthase (glutamine-hydrolysing)
MWKFSTVNEQDKKLLWQCDDKASITLLLDKTFVTSQSESWCVVAIGKLREYGQAYTHPENLGWLLSLLDADLSPTELYEKISGFFVLIVGNRLSGEIQIFNDHLATVPLYWIQVDDTLAIGTHLQALKSKYSKISNQAIYNYFYFHCIPAPLTLYEGISKLLPGNCLRSTASAEVSLNEVYNPRYQESGQDTEALQQQCRDVISDAVTWNSPADCGAFLSGGLDSSTVSGMLAKNTGSAKTFSIGFNAKGYDETEYALLTAKHFNTEHKTHYLEPEEILTNFVDVAGYFEEPFGNSSALAAFICAKFAKDNGVNTLLAGDGGDELFAGNQRYVTQKIFDVYSKIPAPLRKLCDLVFDKSPIGNIPLLRKGRSYIRQARVALPDRLQTYNFLNRLDRTKMFEADFFKSIDTKIPSQLMSERYDSCPSDITLEKLLYLDWKFTLADNDLVKVSQMCQKAGVDVRYPLLEKEVVDFSCTVPAKKKLPGMKLRHFFKKSFSGFLADETINKPKHGFGLPFGVWMKENSSLSALTNDYLNALRKRNIINSDFIDEALKMYQDGYQGYYGELIWIMLVLEVWLQQNEDECL